MKFLPEKVYHVYNRGNDRQKIFFNKGNYQFFIGKLCQYISSYSDVLTWCLMPNHFHIMLFVHEEGCNKKFPNKEIQNLSYWIGIALSSYSQAINKQEGRTGSLFQSKTKAKILNDENAITRCMHYIHQNPLKAKFVKKLEDWEYSSFVDYAGLRNSSLCNQRLLFGLTGCGKDHFLRDSYTAILDYEDFL